MNTQLGFLLLFGSCFVSIFCIVPLVRLMRMPNMSFLALAVYALGEALGIAGAVMSLRWTRIVTEVIRRFN